jgi:hypothetical protein
MPGIITAIAGLVTAVTGLLLALNRIGDGGAGQSIDPQTTGASTSTPSESVDSGAEGAGDALVGSWAGTAASDGGGPFHVRLEVTSPCRLRAPCGTIAVSSTPCRGHVTLWTVRSQTYEFYVDEFTGDSSPDCTPGAGDFFERVDDGTLRYTTGYDAGIEGVLHKVG